MRGDSLRNPPNVRRRPPLPPGRVARESPESSRHPVSTQPRALRARNFAPALPSPPIPSLGRLPAAGAAAGLPKSRAKSSGSPAPGGRAAGIVCSGAHGEPKDEAGGRAGAAGTEGAAGRGSRRSPPGAQLSSAPRSLWPSCAGRGRASEEEP